MPLYSMDVSTRRVLGIRRSSTTTSMIKKHQSPGYMVAVVTFLLVIVLLLVDKAHAFASVPPLHYRQPTRYLRSTTNTKRVSLKAFYDADKRKPALQRSNAQSSGSQEGGEKNDNDAFRNDEYEVQVTPEVQELIARLTENYVFAKEDGRAAMVDEVLALVESNFKVRQVPVQIGQTIFDAATTGIALDQSVAEIMSFAAYHGLPSRLTAELLDESLGDAFATARKIFVEQGWQAVFFPQGLGIQPRRQKRRWLWTKRKQVRVAEAIRAVRAAAAARNPIRQLSSQKEFLAKLVAEEYTKATDVTLPQKNMPFFPQNLPLPSLSWRRLSRAVEQSSSKIRQKGKAGILAYAVFNFFLYSVGMLWTWRITAGAEVTSTSNAAALTLRKFGRVFATVFIISNLLKVPKVLTVAALSRLTDRFLQWAQSKTKLPETRLLVLCLTILVAVWAALMAVPLVSDYTRIQRLIFLESLLYDQYTITRPAMVLSTT